MKLRDPLAMSAIRGVYAGSLTNHEEIDCQGGKKKKDRPKVKRKSKKFKLYPCGLKSRQSSLCMNDIDLSFCKSCRLACVYTVVI